MQLSKKESNLIEVFLIGKKELTAYEIADELGISTKTVYRVIRKINDLSHCGEIIPSVVGKGFSLNYDNYLQLVNSELTEESGVDAENRRNTVLLELTFKSPHSIHLYDRYEKYYVSKEMMYKDLEKMRETVAAYRLEIKRKGAYVAIKGKEKDIRRLSYNLISIHSFLRNESYTINNETINSYDADFITSQLEYIEKHLGSTISYPYNINIFSHIYILLSRLRKGRLPAYDEEADLALDEEEQAWLTENHSLYQLAESIIAHINRYLCVEVPAIENFYLFQYIISSRFSKAEHRPRIADRFSRQVGDYMVSAVEKELALSLESLRFNHELYEHIHLLLYRNQNEIVIKNELLGDICREYAQVYQALIKINEQLAKRFAISPISEDELGFIALYFAKAMEEITYKKRVLIMCSSGVGTSELLKVKVGKAFPDIEVVDVVSLNQYKKEYQSAPEQGYDFILTTVLFNKPVVVPVLLVNVMFTQQDQQNVKKLLEELNDGKFGHSQRIK